jgi:hypothetical protein
VSLEFSEQVEFAWACGLFEGEGSISRQSRSKGVVFRIGSCDKDVIDRFQLAIGNLGSRGEEVTSSNKEFYILIITRWSSLEPLLRRMYPFMGKRRKEKIMEMLGDPPRALGEREMCALGRHVMSPENVIINDSYGRLTRKCRLCHNERCRDRKRLRSGN